MNISIDISYYPLKDEFIPTILDFIDRLNQHKELKAKTNGMSTQVFGEYFYVMNAITGQKGKIHRAGVNYVICVTEDGEMFRAWVKDIRDINRS